MEDDKFLVTSGAWLNDRIIDAVNKIVSAHFADISIQSVNIAQTNTGFIPLTTECIVILHDQIRSHWITSAYITGEVVFMDSLPGSISGDIKQQLKQLYAQAVTKTGSLPLKIVTCSRQTNNSDCGVYAAAFAFELAINGRNSMNYAVEYDVNCMRGHLVQCLENSMAAPFSQLQNAKRNRKIKPKYVTI